MNATDGPIKPRRLLTRCGRVQRRRETGTQARIQVITPMPRAQPKAIKNPHPNQTIIELAEMASNMRFSDFAGWKVDASG